MKGTLKKRASTPQYVSPNQLVLAGFETTPFEKELNPNNRWVVLARLIPWDDVCSIYNRHVGVSNTGRPPLNSQNCNRLTDYQTFVQSG